MGNFNINWYDNILYQIDFYQRGDKKKRTDKEYRWELFDNNMSPLSFMKGQIKTILRKLGMLEPPENFSFDWLNWLETNAPKLWEARLMLKDEISLFLFDETLILRAVGFQKFYYPRVDYYDFIEVLSEESFCNEDLPDEYIGLPLKLFKIRLKNNSGMDTLNIITSKEDISLLNSYKQYFIRRKSVDISPVRGDVVLDCGACIGDISLMFAGLVGKEGEVHLFDPVPLHIRFCKLQASLNPSLADIMIINTLAVGNRSYVSFGEKNDSDIIAPGGLAVDSYTSTSLDDYIQNNAKRVDYIKMDIEGAEMDAIDGAVNIIKEYKPRLAISVYHKPDDIFEIPFKLNSLNPDYRLFFGHHSPFSFESVLYAL